MLKSILITALVTVVCVGFSGCEKKPPIANGKDVLTNEQYNALRSELGLLNKNGQKGQATATHSQEKNISMANGSAYFRNYEYGKAVAEFEAVLEKNPDNARAWYMLGSSLEKMNQTDQAQAAYKKSYDLMVNQGYVPKESLM